MQIVTTDDGPLLEDVFWLLGATDGTGLLIPGSRMSERLLGRLQQLEGFDNQAVIAAMGSTDHARFDCWTAERS